MSCWRFKAGPPIRIRITALLATLICPVSSRAGLQSFDTEFRLRLPAISGPSPVHEELFRG
eukprot:7834387-Heterocapsa_arctica.AAC.1